MVGRSKSTSGEYFFLCTFITLVSLYPHSHYMHLISSLYHNTNMAFRDLSGHPEFFEIRNEFYKDSQGVLLCFDLSSRASFEALDSWIKEANKFGLRSDAVIFLVATKVTLFLNV
jgi:GTPase SAR1 family protein